MSDSLTQVFRRPTTYVENGMNTKRIGIIPTTYVASSGA